jgi:hypothetical protein
MSRKMTLSLAATATLAMATLTSQSADAGFRGGHSPIGGSLHTPPRVTPIYPIAVHVPRAQIPPSGGPINPIIRVRQPPPSGGLVPPVHPGGLVPPVLPPPDYHHHHHHHWVFRDSGWIMIDDGIDAASVVAPAAPEAASTPGPCTCLTKTYTRSGLVVFADVCTKESASAPVDSAVSDASQAPTSPVAATAVPMSAVPTSPNYAGRTYEDYLAATPQATQPQASNPSALQGTGKN